MTPPTDFRARDEDARVVIRKALGETLFVEAGAGTGKTRALVDRVVALVCSGVAIDRIAAITFTERAAAELRERVRTGLEQERHDHPEHAEAVGVALGSLDRAQISTIHAFCQAIVRTYSPEAGVDPDFEVQDEVMTQRRMQERWRRYLESLGDDEKARREIDRLLNLGLRTNELEQLALALASRGELAEILADHPPKADEPAWPDLRELRGRLDALGWEDVDPADSLGKRIVGIVGVVDAINARPAEEREEFLAAGGYALADRHKGSNTAWGGAANKDAALEEVSAVESVLSKLLDDFRAAALAAVMPRLIEFVRQDEVARGRDGSLTFDDLILRARRLLAKGGEAVTSLRNRYHALLIDEFQDTDPMQVEIATAFATDPATKKMQPGRLFLVGDPKQSIYRFRRADMATYAQTAERMQEGGAQFPALALNRRSRGVILGWVNKVFEQIIGDGNEPAIQPPYAAIHPLPERDVRLTGPGVATFGGVVDSPAREVRTVEARELAALCRKAVEEQWQVAERGGSVRDAKYGDVAILMPRRTGLIALERGLAAAGVPYRVESGSLIYRTQEIRDLVNCLTAIDDPADEVAIVAALRSPAFACSDVDLARHRARGGYFNYHNKDLEKWEGQVGDGLRALGECHDARHNTSLAALVERFVFTRGTIETGVLDQRDRNSFRRARFMIERARTFEAAGPESLRAFVAWLENQSEAAILDNEGASVDDDEDAVRVLTIHGAKGLEFPIVFLAGLSAAPMTNRPPLYSADFAGNRVAICVGSKGDNRRFILGDFEELYGAEDAHLQAEFNRLLYVASTRARDHLVVSLYHNSRASGCAAKRLIDAGASELATRLDIADVHGTSEARTLDGLTVEVPAELDASNFAAQRADLLARAKTLRFTSATGLKRDDAARLEEKQDEKPERDDDTEPWSRGRGGTRVGRAVHAAIQSLRLDADDAAIAAVARAQAVAEAVPHRENDVVKLVRWVVRESEAWKRARGAVRAMREVPFALEADGTVLEGYIDLVLQTADGIEIVDWKTDQIARDGITERLEQYKMQAGLYVYGLEEATGQRVTKVTYVFASPKVEEAMGDPAVLAKAARKALAASGRVS
jgi:ATP-dependent helicase/nuclease subunit A